MPYTLKTQQISVKDPDSGEYIGVDVLTEQTKEGLITELQDEGNIQVARINQAAVDVQSAVDQAETEAQQLISSTQSSLNTFETQKDTIAQTIASMAELGTDTALTTAGMAADAKKTGDEISNVKNAISQLDGIKTMFENVADSTVWELGAIKSADGTQTTSTSRIRSKDYLKDIIKITGSTGYKYTIAAYTGTSASSYVGMWNGSSFVKSATWLTGETVVYNLGSYYYRIVAAKQDDTTITTAAGVNMSLIYATDTSLTRSGKSADAKVTGDKFSIQNTYASKAYYDYIPNKYIYKDGRILDVDNFAYSTMIAAKAGEKFVFTATGYQTSVAMISECSLDFTVITPKVISQDGVMRYEYTPESDTFLVVSFDYREPHNLVKYTPINEYIIGNNKDFSLSLIGKFGVVGDSYASGELYYNNAYHDNYAISWGQIMARHNGTVCTNYSAGGLTTRSWLTDAHGLPLVQSSAAEDIYYLALGLNDAYTLGNNYLGALTDITSHSSYTEYGDTFYGNYGRIIEQILIHAPNAKLIMFTLASSANSAYRAYNGAIANIADYYNIPCIVQFDDEFFGGQLYTDMVQGHPRALGYAGMASAFERLIKRCVSDNYDYFKNIYAHA